jgi:predicted TIM-barrel fold metal-dependent hydrolase
VTAGYHHRIDPENLTAIDTHVHVQIDDDGRLALPQRFLDAMATYFGASDPPLTVDQTAEHFRERGIAAVVFTVDATTATGHRPNSIDHLVAGAARNADVLIPFGSVDPLQDGAALVEATRQAEELGVQGFKFHPTVQDFDPSDPRFDPLFGHIEELGLPVVVHTGQTGVGAASPGGLGLRLRLSDPMLLDDVAARHPRLQIVLAHPSVPWQDEAIAMATHKSNVWIDLSGWAPKYFSPNLVRAVDSYLRHKVLFGSDFPAITPDRWLRDFAALDLKDETRPAVLKDNAVRLLGLAP